MEGLAEELTAVVVLSLFTVCESIDDVFVAKFVSPPYTAVMLWVLTESVNVENVATPAPFRVPVPRVVAPSLKVTVPVGVPDPGDTAATVAVKVTDWPKTDGLTLDVREAVVDAVLTA